MFRYLPEQGSDFAHIVDNLNNAITDISLFFTVAIVGTMIYFAIKYRKRDGVDHETPRIEGNHLLEVVWTVVPTIICVIVAVYGYKGFEVMRDVPANPIEINVKGKKWQWAFEYANGKRTNNEFYVPVGKPIKLILTSEDVLHSFFVPGMRTKMDAVPGYYTYQWFRPIKTGPQQVYCTEYCGTQHSYMLAKMHVVSEAEFERWLNEKEREISDPIEAGRKLYVENACNTCHSLDGKAVVGPTFLNLFGKKRELADGSVVDADENYIRESILNSNAKIAKGFAANIMPAFEGRLDDDQLAKLIAFIKAQKGEEKKEEAVAAVVDTSKMTPAERGKALYQSKACIGCHSLDGTKLVGPTFKGITGRFDEAYIKESILNPNAKISEGFTAPSLMPQIPLTDTEVADIIEFMKTVE